MPLSLLSKSKFASTVGQQIGLPNLRATLITAVLVASGLFLSVVIRGQTHGVPYSRDFGPGFHALAPEFPYLGSFENIAEVNFYNKTVTMFDEDKHVLSKARLRNGWYEHRDKFLYETVKLDSVHYLPSQDATRQFALVLYTWFAAGGSSSTDGLAEVYALEAHQLKLVQQFSWDEHFETDNQYASFDKRSQSLTVRSGHYLPGDAHCCVSANDVVTLGWNGQRLVKKSLRVELTTYGRKNAKRLSP
jgi:hypothetical protein